MLQIIQCGKNFLVSHRLKAFTGIYFNEEVIQARNICVTLDHIRAVQAQPYTRTPLGRVNRSYTFIVCKKASLLLLSELEGEAMKRHVEPCLTLDGQ